MAETGGVSMARIIKSNEEDRISSLPDFLVHRILSFLPATDLPKTSFLSKWWNNQWTHVHVLEFVPNDGMSPEIFSNFIDKTLILHDCSNSNIHKFKIKLGYDFFNRYHFPNMNLWIRFAVRKYVKELILDIDYDGNYHFSFPEFVFNHSSLVKLELSRFVFMTFREVNWVSVKSLRLYDCQVEGGAIENALSGSPLLEYLELRRCDMFQVQELVIASKTLKTLILDGVNPEYNVIEISCPNLERLRVSGQVGFRSLKLTNLPSSVHATLDFFFEDLGYEDDMRHDDYINLVQQTLRQVEHVEKLEVGRRFMKWRSHLERSTQRRY